MLCSVSRKSRPAPGRGLPRNPQGFWPAFCVNFQDLGVDWAFFRFELSGVFFVENGPLRPFIRLRGFFENDPWWLLLR